MIISRLSLERILRYIFLLGAICIIVSLFVVGAKPMAVGLFPPPLDKVIHFATFGLIAAFLWLSLLRGHPWLVIALVALVGAADELHQCFLPGRSPGWDDFGVDVLAAIVIVGLLALTHRRHG
jgi:hypothetical protein